MKYFVLYALCFLLITISSCKKVISYDLDTAESALVIEAKITNTNDPFTVVISKTTSYFSGTETATVSGATVSVKSETDEGSWEKYFDETTSGLYQLENTNILPGNWYVLTVVLDGLTYTASSYLNELVPIEELTVSYFDGYGFLDSGYKINCFIRDPPGIENYYRMKMYIDGKVVNNEGDVDVYSDKLFDGKEVGLVQNSSVAFSEEDTVVVELQSIDKAAYEYFSTLDNITGLEYVQSASPANPTSNFDNGALGYFSAYSYDRKMTIISKLISNK
jgi:hypothetical protein